MTEHRTSGAGADPSLGDLFSQLTNDVGDLVRSHIELAKSEITQEVTKAGRGAGLLGGGAIAALVSILMLSLAAGWGLAEVVEPGWAFLIVGLAWAAVAAALAYLGKEDITDVDPTPDQTMNELEEDQRWLKNQVT